jgi:putative transposase
MYRLISAEKARAPVSITCDLLGVSRSGFYDWERRVPSDRALGDAWLTEKIKLIWVQNRKVYGAPRVHAELRIAHGVRLAESALNGSCGRPESPAWSPRSGGERRSVCRASADDLVERQFRPTERDVLCRRHHLPVHVGAGSISPQCRTRSAGGIVGRSMADHMRAELVVDALEMARSPAAARAPAWFITQTKAVRADSSGRRKTR